MMGGLRLANFIQNRRTPVVCQGLSVDTAANPKGLVPTVWNWIKSCNVQRSGKRRLRVSETVSLGDKRFVALVHVDGLQFLLGGSATSVTLLAELKAPGANDSVVSESMSAQKSPTNWAPGLVEELS